MSGQERSEERLYHLLPAIYRQKDLEEGEPLRALMAVIEEQMRAIESDIEGLYENWFIETCQEWVLPYIGDLLGMRPLRQTIAAPADFSQRAHVANTQAYRRRKGTVFVLEQAARDATGWPALAREFFPLLATSQNINHIRHSFPATIDLKDARRMELLGGPFEDAAHTAEVGLISNGFDHYNIKNIGIFFWRLNSYAITKGDAGKPVGHCCNCLSFSPLGLDIPLFNRPQTEKDITHLADEINVPGRLSIRALYREIECRRAALEDGKPLATSYFGDDPVFQIFLDNKAVQPEEMIICSLKEWQAPGDKSLFGKEYKKKGKENSNYINKAYRLRVAVDPQLGRLMLLDAETTVENGKEPAVQVSYSYGFAGEIGGGPYSRKDHLNKWLEFPGWDRLKNYDISTEKRVFVQEVSREGRSLKDALSEWIKYAGRNKDTIGLIIIEDSSSIAGGSNDAVLIDMPADSKLAIIAAIWPKSADKKWWIDNLEPEGVRPHLKADLKIRGQASSELILDGLLIDGKVELVSGIGRLRLSDCTLYPEKRGLVASEKAEGSVIEMHCCICGPIKLENKFSRLEICESIIDGLGGAAISARSTEIKIQAGTVIGSTAVVAVQAENSIFTGKVEVERVQAGCIRFCYLPKDSVTPRRYHCQPDKAVNEAEKPEQEAAILKRMVAAFTSVHYGHPGYGQLSSSTPEEILSGSEDGSEMGAFSANKQPQREADLRDCLDEYLPLGLNAGIFYVD